MRAAETVSSVGGDAGGVRLGAGRVADRGPQRAGRNADEGQRARACPLRLPLRGLAAGGANARPWLCCRGRRSTAPRRHTPSPMTTVHCRPLPPWPGISSPEREVVCCALQAGRTTAHEPPMLAALLLNLGVVYAHAGQPNNDIINTHSLPAGTAARPHTAQCQLSAQPKGQRPEQLAGKPQIWNVSSEGRLGVGDRAPAGLDGMPRVQVVHPLRHKGRRQRRQPADRLHRLPWPANARERIRQHEYGQAGNALRRY